MRHIPAKTVPPSLDVDIGSVLKEARLKKGHAVDVVCQHTRIPKKLVEALEANRLEDFPAMVYLRGFLKIYCDYLEVDFESVWKKIVPDQPPLPAATPAAGKDAARPSAATRPAATTPPAGKDGARPSASARPGAAASPKTPRPPSAAPGGSAGKGERLVSEDDGRYDAKQSASRADARPAPEKPAPDAPSSGLRPLAAILAAMLIVWTLVALMGKAGPPQADPSAEAPAPPPVLEPISKPVEPVVGLAFKRDAWIHLSVDDKVRFEGIVPHGARQEYRPKVRLVLKTPNPSDITLTLNGAPTDFPKADAAGDYVVPAR
ncbi:MAG: DUF4115 domain-containing protein [Elusimicrobia bacterium]|nr:DUF4115 domain-containing protein [Elusimicrobiota bacterium]